MTADKPAAEERPETPGTKFASNPVCTTPATVDLCRADYLAGADIRAKVDATAKRQHRGG